MSCVQTHMGSVSSGHSAMHSMLYQWNTIQLQLEKCYIKTLYYIAVQEWQHVFRMRVLTSSRQAQKTYGGYVTFH